MTSNYNGLTKNSWPGTWVPSSNAPIAIDNDLRGTLQSISGNNGDRLTDIHGQRLNEGMLVYVAIGYTVDGVTRAGDTYYKYNLLSGQSRDSATGAMPNSESNWSELAINGSAGGGSVGATGATGPIGATGPGSASRYIKKDFPLGLKWQWNHQQNSRNFLEKLTTSGGQRVYANVVTIDDNNIEVVFTEATVGTVELFFIG